MKLGIVLTILSVTTIVFIVLMGCVVDTFFSPNANWRDVLSENLKDLYRVPLQAWHRWRCKRARLYLFKHNTSFQKQEASSELVRRRREFYDSGGSPMDPKCPTLFDILEERGQHPFKRQT